MLSTQIPRLIDAVAVCTDCKVNTGTSLRDNTTESKTYTQIKSFDVAFLLLLFNEL